MSRTEYESPTLGEKAVWWAKYGGIIAGMLGWLARSTDLLTGGAVVAASGFIAEQTLYKRK